MNLRDLEYLVAVDEERHFHRAAARCFVSQPTLSGQLKKLEQELGVLLIERTNRQVSMTEAGIAVVEHARKALAETAIIKDVANNYKDPMTGDIRVGIIPTIAPYLLPIIMPHLHNHFKNLKLWLYEYQTQACLEKLNKAELDFLILALPIEKHDFTELDLFREPFRLAVNREQLLAKKKHLNLGDITNQKLLLLEEGHCLRGHILDVCLLAGVQEQTEFQATSLETLRHMVGEGMGMTLMPELAVPKKTSKADDVRYIEFSDPKPNRRIGMLYRKNNYREDTFNNIAELIKSVLPVNVFF
ncbi:MAG: DNA-binding transcriptional regulator OxyR [Gammaproteobacteria bacterium]|nr:DNA-binding transcriptional regulator OxyR [Gammaproteobacteria bacterium]MCW8986083.1 DNA-binding transcriptional regulator OxyR [Gammaproteobacteria bacterium]MCW9030731.1 DNA-binding transcriptional regulator OxyR [Gammaproteobacteria bacterium]